MHRSGIGLGASSNGPARTGIDSADSMGVDQGPNKSTLNML